MPASINTLNGDYIEHVDTLIYRPETCYSTPQGSLISEEHVDHSTATTIWLWPDEYYRTQNDDDKKSFERYLLQLCHSKKRSLTRDVKSYLKLKEQQGIIKRPTQQNTEWNLLKAFNYPYVESTYYGV